MQHLFIALNAKFFKGLTSLDKISLDKIPLDFKWCTLEKPFYFITIFFDSSSNVEKAAHFKKREKSKTWRKRSKRKLETYLKIK
jgi:hypothetical protein